MEVSVATVAATAATLARMVTRLAAAVVRVR